MFTKLWQWMMIVMISSSVLVVQAQKVPSAGKAVHKDQSKQTELKSVNDAGFTEDQMITLEKAGIGPEMLKDEGILEKAMNILGLKQDIFGEEGANPDLTDLVSVYTFSQSVGTFTPITGGTLLGSTTSDDQRFVDPAVPLGGTTVTGVGFPIGFNFTFNGYVFDRFAINNNGWISLGQSALTPAVNIGSTSGYLPLSSVLAITPVQLRDRISAVGRDLQAQTGASLRIETIGTTPSQTLVIQWLGYKKYGSTGTGDNYNFQIRLNEGTNTIDLVYGTMTNNATSTTVQVGLGGDASTDYYNRSTTTDWSATTAGAINTASCTLSSTVYPVSGLTFTFTPPAAGAPGSPSNPNPPNSSTGVAISTNLTWDFGTLTETYDLYFDDVNPPVVKVVDNAVAGTALYDPPADLDYSTTYYWQIVARNSSKLETQGPVWNFTTVCGPYTLPYTENFDGVTVPALPMCTSYENTNGDAYYWQTYASASSPPSAPNVLYIRYNSTLAMNDWFFTPGFNLTGGTSYTLNFKYTNNSSTYIEKLEVKWGNAANSAAMTNGPIFNDDNIIYNNVWQDGSGSFTPGSSGVYYLGFHGYSDIDEFYLYVDNLSFDVSPSCIAPTALTVANIGANSADLGWTENGTATTWDIELGADGFIPTGTPTQADVTSNPYNYGSLSPSTSYDFYVRSNCGGGDYSIWTGPMGFTTACATYTAPFEEHFQNQTIPNCWSMTGPQSWLFTTTWPGYGATGLTDHTGTGGSFAGVDGSGSASLTDITLYTPFIDISGLTNPAIRFYLFNNNINNASYQTLRVDFWDGAAWNNSIYFWGPTDNDPNWVEVIASVVPYTITGDIQFRFVVDKSAGSPFYDDLIIDDVYVEEGPTCPNPGGLGATNISTTSADLTWMSISGLSDVEFGAAGFVPTGTPTHTGVTSPLTVAVTSSSSYDFYVRDDCGGGDYSNWVGPYNFDTPCETFVAPYSEDFTIWPPLCWDLTGGTYSWAQYTTGVVCAYANFWGQTAGNTDVMTTNTIDVSGLGSPYLKFDWSHLYHATYPNDTLKVLVSDDGGSTWTIVWVKGNVDFNSNDGAGNTTPGSFVTSGNIDLTSFGDEIMVQFFGLSGYGPNVYIDNVMIFEPLAHDVASLSLDMSLYYEPGSVTPMATVTNYGINMETFNVTMTIGAYNSTKQVIDLLPGANEQVTFDPWNATIGSYTAQVCTQLGTDLDNTNDCLTQPVDIQELRKIYCYVAYDPTAVLPEGPAWTSIQHPDVITSLAATTSEQFIAAGTWAEGIWYGSEYYDATALTGGGWWTIDPTTGAMTELGDYDLGFAGITYNPNTGIMYGTYWDGVNNQLYTIDMATGAPTLVGTIGTSLLINLASDGSNYLYGVGITDDVLYQVDPSVPSVTAIGATGQSFNYAQDMEYDFENDIMYVAGYTTVGQLFTIDLTTGVCTLVGNFQGGSELTGVAIPYVLGYRITGNVYYGLLNSKPMATNTTVTLTPGTTVSTGALGYYEFTNILDGNYTMTGASTKPWGGLQALDAIQVQRFVSGAVTFTDLQKRAGDINKSSSVQNLDATFIRRRVSSIAVPQWTAPDWIFDGPFGTPPALQELPVTVSGGDVVQDLRTLCSGDVNGSYSPPAE